MNNKDLLEQEWTNIQKKVVEPLWKKYQYMYESLKLDYDDFESLVGFEITKAIDNFDDTKSKLSTFVANVVERKAKSELRNYGSSQKRSGFYKAISIESTIGEEGETTLVDILEVKEDKDISVLTQRYLDSLTKMQRKVADLFMQGCNEQDVKAMLGLSNDRYKLIVMNMCESRKLEPLKKLKERVM